MIAVIAGSTGLVGNHLLNILEKSEDYTGIITIGRRTPETNNKDNPGQKRTDKILDLSEKDKIAAAVEPGSDFFICLGTTIKKAGSQDAFRVVDFEFPVNIARAAAEKQARSVHLVSALGADSSSSIFYNRVKGETENEVRKTLEDTDAFLYIYRPSLLLGKRSEFRAGETMATVTGTLAAPFLSIGPLRAYKPVQAEKVARSMVFYAKNGKAGCHIIESKEIRKY